MQSARLLLAASCACFYVLAPARVWAGPLFELVGDDAGFTGRASPTGPRAAYFNPALLLAAPVGVTLGVLVLVERLELRVGARDSVAACRAGACDVPEVSGAGPESFRHADGTTLEQPTLPTAWLENGQPGGGEFALRARPRQAAAGGHAEHGYLWLQLRDRDRHRAARVASLRNRLRTVDLRAGCRAVAG